MTDRDSDTGQFISEGPEVFGLESVERDQGYIPLPDPGEAVSDELTVEEAASLMGIDRTAEGDIRTYAEGLEEEHPTEIPRETVTAERAGKEAEAFEAREAEAGEAAQIEALRKEVDELRGAKPEQVETEPAEEAQTDAKAVANEEVEAIKQQYHTAIENADHLQSAAFRARFPELASQPVENWEALLTAMPTARAQEAIGTLQELVQVKAALHQRQTEVEAAQRATFKANNDRFEAKHRDVPKERRAEIETEIIAALSGLGVDMQRAGAFLRQMDGSTEALELLWELGDARSQLKAIKSAAKAVPTRAHVPVQKPGIASNARSVDSDIAMLDRRLTASGSLKDARALLNAQLRRG